MTADLASTAQIMSAIGSKTDIAERDRRFGS
jgi:hypothetical protein